MKRRTFFKRIGLILAALGVSETEWLTLGDRYYQVLAQPTPHKLALLIGINKYQKSPSLSGCLTDVELQKELLMHRFGFQAADILTLTEEQADKKSIETAFVEHLGKQAKSGDVVVFHFSGYGTRIKSAELADTVLNALVLAKEYYIQDEKIVNYLWEENLLLLLRSLSTDRVTAVLDTSYYSPTSVQPTGWGIRVRPELVATQLAAAELDFLQQLKNQTALNTQNAELSNIAVLSASSDPKQSARELLFSGFSAGLFTYALTQYLWEITPAKTIQFSLSHVGSSIHQLGSKQQPGLLSSKNNKALTIGNFLPDDLMGAEGAVIGIEEDGKTANLWLGGIPPQVLEYYSANSRLTLPTGEQLVLRSRSGLTAKASIAKLEGTNSLKVGQLLQEAVRVLPRNINLTVALSTGLERIERVDATSAFAGVDHVSTVMVGEQSADYVFGKLLQTPSRYGLFSLDGEVIGNTAGEVGEAVRVAVLRLAAKFPALLAAKLWRLTENEGSSRLAVKATLEIINTISSRVIIKRETLRTLSLEKPSSKSLATQTSALTTPIVPIGSRMQYRVQNQGDRPLYLMLLGLKNNRTAIGFYPWQTLEESNISETQPMLKPVVVAPGETVAVPQTEAASGLMVSGPAYECEYQLILSTAPFSKTLEALETAKYPIADRQFINTLVNPLEVAQALLQDLHNTSTIKAEMNSTTSESYVLDVNNWASLNFSFQVA
ncbi:caspase family protein [Nostocaceae cyanobacterium CENA357]|uniref:Caspase family protein n=1 Tax=Atlanticothrix silvestris CENA357 TaxID=1725252 RepID=A0A8J7HIZ8_9CYAN|nr:caspase family protein [Atlanticothrix silvestris]MBH8553431.1 caspase family protein [Atlanticothrix silvestris CENA357]